MAASNEHSDRKFYTRNRDEWCFPWALPPTVSQEVSSAFRDSMGDYIADTMTNISYPPVGLGYESDTDYSSVRALRDALLGKLAGISA